MAPYPYLKAKSSSVSSEEWTKSSKSFPSDLNWIYISNYEVWNFGWFFFVFRFFLPVKKMATLKIYKMIPSTFHNDTLEKDIYTYSSCKPSRSLSSSRLFWSSFIHPHQVIPTKKDPRCGSHFMVTHAALEKSPLVNTGLVLAAQSPKTRTIAGAQLDAAGEKVAK